MEVYGEGQDVDGGTVETLELVIFWPHRTRLLPCRSFSSCVLRWTFFEFHHIAVTHLCVFFAGIPMNHEPLRVAQWTGCVLAKDRCNALQWKEGMVLQSM